MAKQVQKWEASDGTQFPSEQEADAHDVVQEWAPLIEMWLEDEKEPGRSMAYARKTITNFMTTMAVQKQLAGPPTSLLLLSGEATGD